MQNGRGCLKLTTYLQLVQKLRMRGVVPLLPLYALIGCTAIILQLAYLLYLYLHYCYGYCVHCQHPSPSFSPITLIFPPVLQSLL